MPERVGPAILSPAFYTNLRTGLTEMYKYEIALALARRYAYTSYLEICTPLTGQAFNRVDKEQFRRRVRLMYQCPPDFTDGERVDFSTESESCEELFGELIRSGERFDLVFLDPQHDYATSLRDMVFGLRLMKDDGILLIHDCSPPGSAYATPEYNQGDWCGLTFAAYLDIVLFAKELHYITVDTDFGCGVVCRDRRFAPLFDPRGAEEIASRWRTLDPPQRYSFLDENRARLLRLVSVDEFRRHLAEQGRGGIGRLLRLMKRQSRL